MNIHTKCQFEQKIVLQMITIYCNKKHGTKTLCPSCQALYAYATMRSDKCPLMKTKTFCSNCQIHCYTPEMREAIRKVMRFSGPKMIFHHPVMAIKHVIATQKEKMNGEIKMDLKKILYAFIGCIGVGLGAIGAIVPMLPAFPFLMLATLCFAKSSKKLDTWFKSTKLYKNNLEDYVAGRGMTWKTKRRIMLTVTLLMSIGFIMMGIKGIVLGCIVLGCVWLFHIIYFCFGVKNLTTKEKDTFR